MNGPNKTYRILEGRLVEFNPNTHKTIMLETGETYVEGHPVTLAVEDESHFTLLPRSECIIPQGLLTPSLIGYHRRLMDNSSNYLRAKKEGVQVKLHLNGYGVSRSLGEIPQQKTVVEGLEFID